MCVCVLYDVFDCFPTLHSSHTRLRSANRKTRPSSQIRISEDSETSPNSLRSISESSAGGIADNPDLSSANRKPSCTSSDISLVNHNLSKVEADEPLPPVVVIDSITPLGATKSTCGGIISETVQKDLIGQQTKCESANQKPALTKSEISLAADDQEKVEIKKSVVVVSSSEPSSSTSEIKTKSISSVASSTNQESSLKSSYSPLANTASEIKTTSISSVIASTNQKSSLKSSHSSLANTASEIKTTSISASTNQKANTTFENQSNKIEEISTTESIVDTMLAKSDSGFSEKANTEEEEGEYYDDEDEDEDFDPDLKTELNLDKAYQLFDKKIGAKFQNFNEDNSEEDELENGLQSIKNKGEFKEYFFLLLLLFFRQLFVYISPNHSAGQKNLKSPGQKNAQEIK